MEDFGSYSSPVDFTQRTHAILPKPVSTQPLTARVGITEAKRTREGRIWSLVVVICLAITCVVLATMGLIRPTKKINSVSASVTPGATDVNNFTVKGRLNVGNNMIIPSGKFSAPDINLQGTLTASAINISQATSIKVAGTVLTEEMLTIHEKRNEWVSVIFENTRGVWDIPYTTVIGSADGEIIPPGSKPNVASIANANLFNLFAASKVSKVEGSVQTLFVKGGSATTGVLSLLTLTPGVWNISASIHLTSVSKPSKGTIMFSVNLYDSTYTYIHDWLDSENSSRIGNTIQINEGFETYNCGGLVTIESTGPKYIGLQYSFYQNAPGSNQTDFKGVEISAFRVI